MSESDATVCASDPCALNSSDGRPLEYVHFDKRDKRLEANFIFFLLKLPKQFGYSCQQV